MALHHVARSRSLRHPTVAGAAQPKADANSSGGLESRLLKLWLAWRYDPVVPRSGGPAGAVHRVVQRDAESGRSYVYLGDHAWGLEGFDEKQGLAEIDELNKRVTDHDGVYQHEWSPKDLLILDNRSLLHRREPEHAGSGARVLRRSLVFRR